MMRNKFLLLTLAIASICKLEAQVLFKANDMKVISKDLSQNGESKVLNKVLRIAPAKPSQSGSCWYSKHKIDLSRGFETEFTFKLSNHDADLGGGDGFAFMIQNQSENALGGKGDDIGYKGIPYGVVIEFDTYKDPEDNSHNQVALMQYDQVKQQYIREATVHEIPELHDNKEHFARIEYKDGVLIFFLDSYLFPVLTFRLDIATRVKATNSEAWLGFTASTGKAYSDHDILSWSIRQILPPPNIDVKKVEVVNARTIEVKSRDLKISVWDHNQIDGDIVSIKANDLWLITDYTLKGEAKIIDYTFTGFQSELILYAMNQGRNPPNTASLLVDDGFTKQIIKLEATMKKSEA
ncbi:MAG: L-type lectin-domain containing protein, partial [Saprospiraceae bacterium]